MIALTIGIFGITGMSILFPLLSMFFSIKKSQPERNKKIKFEKLEIQVLIPAHNEENSIHQTIKSIEKLGAENIKIHIGVDASTDNTLAIAKSSTAQVTEFNYQNKWNTIIKLVESSNSSWVALTDSGTIWPHDLIQNIQPFLYLENIVGIAPAYEVANATITEKFHWRIERFLKKLENYSGGPTSVHGACVFYKTDILKKVLLELEGTWINDDIVVPLLMQKYGNIHYLNTTVSDIGLSKNQLSRRKRMILGNLEWIKYILPNLFKSNPKIFFKAQRRVFRVFWAYWIIAFSIGCKFPYLLVFLFFVKEAAISSLLAPIYLFKLHKEIKQTRWK